MRTCTVHVPCICRGLPFFRLHPLKKILDRNSVRTSVPLYVLLDLLFLLLLLLLSPLFFANPTLEYSACTDMHNGDVAVKANDLVTIVDLHRWNKSGSTEFWVRDV